MARACRHFSGERHAAADRRRSEDRSLLWGSEAGGRASHLDGAPAAEEQDVIAVEAVQLAGPADGVADEVAVQAGAIQAAHVPDLPHPAARIPVQRHVLPRDLVVLYCQQIVCIAADCHLQQRWHE